MNQNDQMRDLAQKIVDCVDARAIKDWDCLHMYLSEAAQMARQALADHVREATKMIAPTRLVRLTHEELAACVVLSDSYCEKENRWCVNSNKYAQAIMDAMEKINQGETK